MKTKPKVVHIITRLDMGGSAQNTLLNCKELAEKYRMVLVHGLSLESGITDREKQTLSGQKSEALAKGVRFVPVSTLVRRIDPFKDLHALIFLMKLIRKERPVLVHTHSSKAGILGRLAAWLAGVPNIVHTPHGHVFYGHFGPVASRFFLLMERVFDFITDRVIALTEGEKKDYIALSVSHPQKLHTIHSGVDVDRFKPGRTDVTALTKQLGWSDKSLVVGTIGWLLPIKGPDVLFEAMMHIWEKKINALLVYVGKGELEPKLKAEAFSRGVEDRVVFLGWRSDVDDIVQLFDVFVLPSLNEGMGRVLVEAMAAAKPVVASDVGGIPDLVRHKQNGFLVNPGDSKGLAYYIEKLLADRQLRIQMGGRGQELSQHYSVRNMVAKIDALYFSLLQDYRT
ncbi:MAG: glycosyltransferase family 4 protein [Desulfobacterales bacterium]|nr:glycosyltransferase family 4 protein [Desulfobacterales bacterium]